MRLARLLVFSALAARAGGAEAEADWFPRWASFASEHTPYIHSRGYQTLRTSGSTTRVRAETVAAEARDLGLTPNNLVRSMVSEYRDASSRA